ncbi:hypothetical protein PQC38_gp090 [Aeromonas phage BUCT695]|uniref:hypothetical protein n=1 Tax=Aeromonas phage BUCT695 TaxID=2908630 RepID=UPI002329297E|nr:hypothetical protein PQC38_gp090 [Aeromonas phage BUCT695]UIW10566.1 hypothetical protein [Aeromonas phage BUCT695]
MTSFYQMNSIHHNDVVMINLDNVCKVEECENFVRLYLVSGDIEEVEIKTFFSAVNSSGTQYMKVTQSPKEEFDSLDQSDIEDVTDLSDGTMVDDSDLAPAVENSVAEEPIPTVSADSIRRLIAMIDAGQIKVS